MYILMSSDGYEIEYSFYPDLESAQNAMKKSVSQGRTG